MSFGGLGGVAAGTAARYVHPDCIHPAGRYVPVSPNGQPSVPAPVYPALASDVFWRKSGPGDLPFGIEDANQGAFQYISIASIKTLTVAGAPVTEATFLAACVGAGSADATVVDIGVLTTQAPNIAAFVGPNGVGTLGMHSLPVDFGRGQNRWRPGDEDYINVWFRIPKVCQDVAGAAPAQGTLSLPDVIRVTFVPNVAPLVVSDPVSAFGNIQIWVGNRGKLTAGILSGTGRDVETTSCPVMNVEFMHTIQR